MCGNFAAIAIENIQNPLGSAIMGTLLLQTTVAIESISYLQSEKNIRLLVEYGGLS